MPEYQARAHWENPTDVLMWDNRCLMHYAVADFNGQGSRHMDHCATLGGHRARIWDLTSDRTGRWLASALYNNKNPPTISQALCSS